MSIGIVALRYLCYWVPIYPPELTLLVVQQRLKIEPVLSIWLSICKIM